jgi:hypothetical protein
VGDKLHSREGNSPDRRLRSLNRAKWERKWLRTNNQEVVLEAAILKTTLNRGLVERGCAEDSTGLKPDTEAADL